jgi:hypothetical protein
LVAAGIVVSGGAVTWMGVELTFYPPQDDKARRRVRIALAVSFAFLLAFTLWGTKRGEDAMSALPQQIAQYLRSSDRSSSNARPSAAPVTNVAPKPAPKKPAPPKVSAPSPSAPKPDGDQPAQDTIKTSDSVAVKVIRAPSIVAKVTRAPSKSNTDDSAPSIVVSNTRVTNNNETRHIEITITLANVTSTDVNAQIAFTKFVVTSNGDRRLTGPTEERNIGFASKPFVYELTYSFDTSEEGEANFYGGSFIECIVDVTYPDRGGKTIYHFMGRTNPKIDHLDYVHSEWKHLPS